MSSYFAHPSFGGRAASAPASEGPAGPADGQHTERACCCSAKPLVVVIMPPAEGRPHQTDLLLCGHHYRKSHRALAAAGAVATEIGVPGQASQPGPLARAAN